MGKLYKRRFTLNQLITPDGGFIESEVLKNMFGITTMQWNSLISAIPAKWKAELNKKIELGTKNDSNMYESFITRAKASTYYYKEMNKTDKVLITANDKWQKIIPKLECDMYFTAFKNVYKITNNSKLRSLQYRILHNALVFNDRLYKWKITSSDNCNNCNLEKENLWHFYSECTFAQNIWTKVRRICQEYKNEPIELDAENVLLNRVKDPPGHLFNFIVLVVKLQMYTYRCLKKKVTETTIREAINQYRRFELYEAKRVNKLHTHIKKWVIVKQNGHEQTLDNYTGLDQMYVEHYIENM